MTESDQKKEIISTRKGGLGSSDATLVASAAKNGKLTDSQRKRIAVMLGLEEQKQFSTKATEYGNYIEEKVFETLKNEYQNAISNPFNKHERFSEQFGFDVFNHIDFEVDKSNTIVWFECKAVNDNVDDTLSKYKNQLLWHQMIGREKSSLLKKQFALYLVHYHTEDKTSDFDPSKLTIRLVEHSTNSLFEEGLKVVAKEIENFDYQPSEEISAYTLPEHIQKGLEEVYLQLKEIDQLNKKVDDFKAKMLELMETNSVKSINNDLFKISTVASTESVGFDAKKFEYEYPDLYSEFLIKKTVRKSYLKVTIK